MWNVIRAEAVGRSHANSNLPCQDKTFACSWGAAQAFALCDGAGSARLSHYGAEVAARTACATLARGFEGYYRGERGAQNLVASILAALKNEARARECEPRDLASTLLAVAVKDGRFVCVHIGDGVIGALRELDGRVGGGGWGGASGRGLRGAGRGGGAKTAPNSNLAGSGENGAEKITENVGENSSAFGVNPRALGVNSNLSQPLPAGVSLVNGAVLEVISPPQNDEFANVTTFVTSASAVARARFWRGELRGAAGSINAAATNDVGGASGANCADSANDKTAASKPSDKAAPIGEIRAFILMSDGTQQGLYDKRGGTLAGACERLARFAGVLDSRVFAAQMQASLDGVLMRATSDDCSIVLAARAGVGFAGLGVAAQRRLLGLSRGADVAAYARILHALRKPRTLAQLCKMLGARAHLVEVRLGRLCERNFVSRRGDEFWRNLIM